MASGRLLARRDTGRRAESLAAAWLERSGFRILARNWRRPEGELDLVADHDGTCVFVEVRSRTGDENGDPLETVNARKRARIIRAARLYLDSGVPLAPAYRFDVVGVTFPAEGGEPVLVHVPGAFELDG